MSAVRAPRLRAPQAPAQLTIRAATPRDHAPLQFFFDCVLRRDYFLRRGQLAELLADDYHRVWIAELSGILVGVAIAGRNDTLQNALIHPAYRGLNIGQALIRATDVQTVRAKLDMSTGDPRGFYRRLGFRATGRRNAKGNIELLRRPRGAA